jgi:DNA-binding HxlR family transcriptional regulator
VIGDSHRPPRSRCAINAAIEVLGDPWSMLVLRDVIFGRSSARVFGDTSFAAE